MSNVLQELGITKAELQERLIKRLADELMGRAEQDDYDGYASDATFKKKMEAHIRERVDATIEKLAKKHVLPKVGEYIETLTLEQTNKWGEKRGKTFTFIEYLVERCHAYMTEEVNYEGKSKAEADSYSWSARTTRVAHMVHSHLSHSISTAISTALKDFNTSVGNGLAEAVKMQLEATLAKLRVEVKV